MKNLIDLHTHTISSGHAFSTLKENIDEARKRGIKVLGVSDHATSMGGTAHEFYFKNLKIVKEEVDGVRVLRGIEANIIDYDGNIDVNDELLGKLDYVIASLHPPCIVPGNIEENTRAVIKAMDCQKVKIIGHPDDGRFPLDYEQVVLAAKEKGVVLELNNASISSRSFRINGRENQRRIIELCKEYGVRVILSSDAHIYYDIGEVSESMKLLEEANFPEEMIINSSIDNLMYILEK